MGRECLPVNFVPTLEQKQRGERLLLAGQCATLTFFTIFSRMVFLSAEDIC